MFLLKVLDSSRRQPLSSQTPLQISPMPASQHQASAVLSLMDQRQPPTCVPRSYKNARGLSLQSEEDISGRRGAILMSASKKDSIRSKFSCWRTGWDTGHMAADQVTSIRQGNREPPYISPPQLRYVSGGRCPHTSGHRSKPFSLLSTVWSELHHIGSSLTNYSFSKMNLVSLMSPSSQIGGLLAASARVSGCLQRVLAPHGCKAQEELLDPGGLLPEIDNPACQVKSYGDSNTTGDNRRGQSKTY